MNRNKILWIAVVLLAALNIATLATIAYNNSGERADKIYLEPDSQPLTGRYFRETLGFDAAQMEVYRTHSREFRRDANRIINDMNEQKRTLFAELQATQPDTVRLKEIAREIGALHAELKEATIRFYLPLNAVCSPEQKVKLKSAFTPLFRETPTHRNGRGKGHGRDEAHRHGRRKQDIDGSNVNTN